jgi:hypothetical protein
MLKSYAEVLNCMGKIKGKRRSPKTLYILSHICVWAGRGNAVIFLKMPHTQFYSKRWSPLITEI